MTFALTSAISRHVWESKYRYRDGPLPDDGSIQGTWTRVAGALGQVEGEHREHWTARFEQALHGFKFIPGGRILAGAGTNHRVTLFNCFVMGSIEDSIDGIFDALKAGAVTMQQGGGVGYDFSTLRPAGSLARSVGGIASGPVTFMRIWDSMCATMLSTGARRGAMMATLRCDHPDIERFIDAKRDERELRHFNLSVLVSDAFMEAVHNDREWPLVFPAGALQDTTSGAVDLGTVERVWSGAARPLPCRVLKLVRASELWERIMRATYDYAEPGVLFIDRINEQNNLWYRETIGATNPCGEIPLPPWGACNLGAINLTQFVRDPFGPRAGLDTSALTDTVGIAVRMLDNVIEISRFPLEEQRREALRTRRIGLGVTGLADTLIFLGLRYGEERACRQAADIMARICHAAYRTSVALAREKGSFPYFERARYLEGAFIRALPADICAAIEEFGIRNSHLVAIAPTGTISLLAENVSSGVEPVMDLRCDRRVLREDGTYTTMGVDDFAWRRWQEQFGDRPLPSQFVTAGQIRPSDHLTMQAAMQPFVDHAISKTINVPEDFDYVQFRSLYEQAHAARLKGCTAFRPNPVTGEILSPRAADFESRYCCGIDREAD